MVHGPENRIQASQVRYGDESLSDWLLKGDIRTHGRRLVNYPDSD